MAFLMIFSKGGLSLLDVVEQLFLKDPELSVSLADVLDDGEH
jgi:hypothetical protein